MAELVKKLIAGVIRTFMAPLLVWLVKKGIFTTSDAAQWAAEVSIYGATAAWAAWAWANAHRAQLTALAMKWPSSLADLSLKLKLRDTPALTTSKTDVPVLPSQGAPQ